jgi:hypothetical protein
MKTLKAYRNSNSPDFPSVAECIGAVILGIAALILVYFTAVCWSCV